MNDNFREVTSILKRKISYLRFFVYLFLAILVLLTSLLLAWLYSTYQLEGQFETYYSTPPKTPKAFLYLSPREGHYKVGDEFSVDVLVNTGGNSIVVVAAYLSYNKKQMEALSIDFSNSVFEMIAEEKINNSDGKIKITVGKPTPGVNTYNGKVATIRFKTREKANPYIENIYFDFTKDSSLFSTVILDDKKGTNILNNTRGTKIFIE